MDSIASFLQVLNKPIHFFFIGVAIIFVAPAELVWVGYILLAGVLASVVELGYSKITATRKSKKESEQKKEKAKQKEQTALALYDDLNDHEKHMVDSCIYRNEFVYEGDGWHKKYVTSLVIKGFGQSDDFGRAIIFNGDSFLTILRLKGAEIKAAYAKELEEEEAYAE